MNKEISFKLITDAYYDEICNNKKFDKIKFFTDCNKLNDLYKKNYVLLKIFGMRTLLYYISIGFSLNDQSKNIHLICKKKKI